jgi:hypothetical protein
MQIQGKWTEIHYSWLQSFTGLAGGYRPALRNWWLTLPSNGRQALGAKHSSAQAANGLVPLMKHGRTLG